MSREHLSVYVHLFLYIEVTFSDFCWIFVFFVFWLKLKWVRRARQGWGKFGIRCRHRCNLERGVNVCVWKSAALNGYTGVSSLKRKNAVVYISDLMWCHFLEWVIFAREMYVSVDKDSSSGYFVHVLFFDSQVVEWNSSWQNRIHRLHYLQIFRDL